ncbi:hypothetical protein BC567DRAFT_238359 [Phyllosticta citribraziliensis]
MSLPSRWRAKSGSGFVGSFSSMLRAKKGFGSDLVSSPSGAISSVELDMSLPSRWRGVSFSAVMLRGRSGFESDVVAAGRASEVAAGAVVPWPIMRPRRGALGAVRATSGFKSDMGFLLATSRATSGFEAGLGPMSIPISAHIFKSQESRTNLPGASKKRESPSLSRSLCDPLTWYRMRRASVVTTLKQM